MNTAKRKPRVLCVDDERMVLEGLALHLKRRFEVEMAENGLQGLEAIVRGGDFAVVISDMRMPGMNGAEFLSRVREIAPDTVRVLLTGHADMDSALAAINQGQIFRFLTKPCPAPLMLETVSAAAEHYRLVEAEKVLLEQTLAGSIRTLTELLSLASPVAFGRVVRIERRVESLCDQFEVRDRWAIRIAAHLSHIGFITIPDSVAEKVYYGQPLTEAEQEMVAKVPAVSDQLLANIPRLEPVREIIAAQERRFDGTDAPTNPVRGEQIPLGARMLKAVFDLDSLEASGMVSAKALETLAERVGWYDPRVVQALGWLLGQDVQQAEVREFPISGLQPGMVLADDVRLRTGTLLITRGHQVTQGLIQRMKNMPSGTIREPIKVDVAREKGEKKEG
jgi:response regulator RpfG family c-di-GMP phosphodiesterase